MITNSRGTFQIPCTETTRQPKKQRNLKIYKAIGETASIWKKNGNGEINLTFGSYNFPNDNVSPEAAWSFVGSQIRGAMPGMNLGFIDPPLGKFEYKGVEYLPESWAVRNYCNVSGICDPGWKPGATVIHEFCHALGMLHEHQNNLNNMNTLKESIDPDKVIDYYLKLSKASDLKNDISEEVAIKNARNTAELNVLEFYENPDEYTGSNYDKNSIMHYALPDEWFIQSPNFVNPTHPVFVLSEDDKKWLKQRYPLGDPSTYTTLTVKFIDKFGTSSIEAFKYEINKLYNESCYSSNSIICNEVKRIHDNLNEIAKDENFWKSIQEWKRAWVQKVVSDTFSNLIGINFIFKDENDKILNQVFANQTAVSDSSIPNGTGVPTLAPTIASPHLPTTPPVPLPTSESNTYTVQNDNKITIGVMGAMLGIGLIVGIAFLVHKLVSRSTGSIRFDLKR